tara:strand:- start:667 stop:1020 length:354 start_codon:yes stop_codon:yes gene_type:complete
MGVKSKKPTKATSIKNGEKMDGRNNRGQFVPGHSYATGRPKKENCVSDLLRNKGDEIQDDGRTKLQVVIDTLFDRANEGELKAIDMIFDRLEGKAAQKIEVEETILPTGFDIEIIKN